MKNLKEAKELLLKDLCARLPYRVKIKVTYSKDSGSSLRARLCSEGINILDTNILELFQQSEIYTKPYLFPLSNMTEKQRKEYEDALTYHDYVKGGWTIAKSFDDEYIIPYWFVDFCNKNHLDYRGLIPKGLAVDATGLNIYIY